MKYISMILLTACFGCASSIRPLYLRSARDGLIHGPPLHVKRGALLATPDAAYILDVARPGELQTRRRLEEIVIPDYFLPKTNIVAAVAMLNELQQKTVGGNAIPIDIDTSGYRNPTAFDSTRETPLTEDEIARRTFQSKVIPAVEIRAVYVSVYELLYVLAFQSHMQINVYNNRVLLKQINYTSGSTPIGFQQDL